MKVYAMSSVKRIRSKTSQHGFTEESGESFVGDQCIEFLLQAKLRDKSAS